MRFISPFGGYKLTAIRSEVVRDSDGFTRVVKPGYTAEFKKGILTLHEQAIARQQLAFRGTPMNLDGTAIDPVTRASLFDTEWIEDPKLREKVEKVMVANAGGEDYILVEEEKVPAPWAAYDELTVQGKRNQAVVAQRNLEIAAATGASIQHLIDYERENRNDPKVIEAYQAALAGNPTPAEELIEA